MNAVVTHVWDFWLAVPLALGVIALCLGIVFGYLKKVVSPRYPNDD